ncbi:hypothetical protein SDC9_121404 [bioreactor metagenome]|uniref:Uncharacterized protein n=1 Tax=bioreactor metagenome TaxID=1076179 RepID=A0A645CBU3_9ZZZZ
MGKDKVRILFHQAQHGRMCSAELSYKFFISPHENNVQVRVADQGQLAYRSKVFIVINIFFQNRLAFPKFCFKILVFKVEVDELERFLQRGTNELLQR